MEKISGVRPLAVPNLPAGRVTLCAAAEGRFARALTALGIETLPPAPCAALPEEERTHADMLLCHTGGAQVFCAPGQERLAAALVARGFEVTVGEPPSSAYPGSVKYNAAVGGGFALGRFDCLDPALRRALQSSGRVTVAVRQGYAKCATCFVGENAFITEDPGVAGALRARGSSVLLLPPGGVVLSERHHGFFGGASGKIAPGVLAVAGSLGSHPAGAEIARFLKEHGVIPLELAEGPITDIGGILPLMEEYL